ncbi:acyl-CoA dehydrogenase family member 11-like isoform X5 [Notamacropus eugenii]|uniref:acyl-CoA dehydrogenase family member 11-like isoform X5 n=1 Tax=Notamacropus eugenii TaxID=9315 RepID=UPI003B683C55
MLFRQIRPLLGQGLQRSKAWGPRRNIHRPSWPQEADIPFSRAGIGTFFQGQPNLGNQYLEDALLQGSLKRQLPTQVFAEVNKDLQRFGARVSDEILSLGKECEATPPRLQQFDGWGQRVDQILTCPAWKKLKEISAEEGLVAIGYERKYSSWSRMYQVAKLFLFSPSSGMFTCPLAMTDGAAKVLEVINPPGSPGEALDHLTSRDPKRFWTSGQWMTERKGGSDVAHGTETVALQQEDGTYKLFGFKWFTSSIDADVTLALARIMDARGSVTKGTRGLSLFFLKPRDEQGQLNGLEVQRLKVKLGTRQVPTAELLLDGARAHLAMAVVSEGLECFGGQGYMEDTNLAGILRDTQVLTIWEGTTNILALDTLRVLAKSQGQVMRAFAASVQEKVVSSSNHSELAPSVQRLLDALRRLAWQVERLLGQDNTSMEMEARALAYALARIYIGALLVEHAAWTEASPSDIYASQRFFPRWCEQDLCPLDTAQRAGRYGADAICRDIALIYEASPTLKGEAGAQSFLLRED